MILLLLLMLMNPALKYVDYVCFEFSSSDQDIFSDYKTGNFSQKVRLYQNGYVNLDITCENYLDMDARIRLIRNTGYIESLDPELQNEIQMMYSEDYREYMKNISVFLRKRIRYVENSSANKGIEVFKNRSGNCVGFTNLTAIFLKAAGLKYRSVRGFLVNGHGSKVMPQPHRWIEVTLPGNYSFFYDPQYQGFNSGYIVVKGVNDFTKIRKFTINVKDSKKKLVN